MRKSINIFSILLFFTFGTAIHGICIQREVTLANDFNYAPLQDELYASDDSGETSAMNFDIERIDISDKMVLWTGKTKLRGANIFQRKVYPELDGGEFMGSAYVGPPYIQADFDRLSAFGANLVVISHPGLFDIKPPYSLNRKIQANLDRLVDMIAKANMFAVIAFRTGPGRSAFTFHLDEVGDWFDESYLDDSLWEKVVAQDAWVKMWRYTAERYRKNPVVVGYHLMVEPNADEVFFQIYEPEEFYEKYANTLYDWNQLYPRIIKAIREVDPDTPIIVGGMGYSAIHWLSYLKPGSDKRTVYAVHQYEPVCYTHQTGPLRIKYPGMYDVDWDGEKDQFNKEWIDDLFVIIDDFIKKHEVPVAITEFGLMRWEPGAAQFMDDQMDLLESRGINHALWVWDPSWEPLTSEVDDFNFRHGPNKRNHKDVANSKLISIIKKYWGKNTIRPSSYLK